MSRRILKSQRPSILAIDSDIGETVASTLTFAPQLPGRPCQHWSRPLVAANPEAPPGPLNAASGLFRVRVWLFVYIYIFYIYLIFCLLAPSCRIWPVWGLGLGFSSQGGHSATQNVLIIVCVCVCVCACVCVYKHMYVYIYIYIHIYIYIYIYIYI